MRGHGLFECASGHYQGSLTAGTILSLHTHRSAQVIAGDLAVGLHRAISCSAEQTPGGALGRVHLRDVADASAASLTAAARAMIAAGSVVQTDGWNGYADLGRVGYDHHPRRLPSGADIDRWLPFSHIVLSNFKRWTLDIFHGVSPGHLQAYLDEYCYRLNRHDQRQDLFRRVLKPLRPLHRPSALFAAHRHLSGGDGHAEDLPLSPCINVTRSMEIPERSCCRNRRAQTGIPERSVRRPLPP